MAQPHAPPAPRHLDAMYYEIVHGCQLLCRGCPISGLQPKVKRTSLELTERILRNVDVDSIKLFGLYGYGEPLLHPDLPGLFDVLSRQPFRVETTEISTNAQQVDWEQLEAVIRSRQLTHLIVSCDGDASPEEYERLRPPSRWSRLMDFLERASALKRDHAPDLTLTARTIVPHWPDRAKWRALLAPLGWQSHFYHYHRLPDSADNMTGRPLEVPEGTCFFVETFNQLYVQIDGTVVPCCAHPQAGVYGNLQEQTFSEIYHGTARQAFKAELVANRRSMSICGGCEFDAAVKNDPTRIAFQPDVAFREGLIPLARKGRDGEPKLVVTRHKGGV